MIRCQCKAAREHRRWQDAGWRWHWKTGWRCAEHLLPEREYEEQNQAVASIGAGSRVMADAPAAGEPAAEAADTEKSDERETAEEVQVFDRGPAQHHRGER